MQQLPSEFLQDMGNYFTWVRVRFDGIRPDNNTIGSRCSNQEKWHHQSQSGFQDQGGQRAWLFDRSVTNEVAADHVQLPPVTQ